MKCRICRGDLDDEIDSWEIQKLPDLKGLDVVIGDGLCEMHRMQEETKAAKRAWYGDRGRAV